MFNLMKSSGSKTRGREESGQVQVGPTLEEQYQELRRLRKKVHSLTKKASSKRGQQHSKQKH
jgi:hypothetical protein